MIDSLSISQVQEMLIEISVKVISMENQLNDADRVIGDGDHGAAMARGFHALINAMEEGEFDDLTTLFITSGNVFIASVGGSAGIIFGTFFRSGGKALNSSKIFTSEGFTNFLADAIGAIQYRGKAKPGDKTMLDTLYPALEAARVAKDLPFGEFFHAVTEAANLGMEKTRNMLAETGRAKDFGENALGYLDPGAITTFQIIDGMSRFVNSIK
jgi:phosphoenolpyruvate---glycerone phosphotransferase subunit DhaL